MRGREKKIEFQILNEMQNNPILGLLRVPGLINGVREYVQRGCVGHVPNCNKIFEEEGIQAGDKQE